MQRSTVESRKEEKDQEKRMKHWDFLSWSRECPGAARDSRVDRSLEANVVDRKLKRTGAAAGGEKNPADIVTVCLEG